MRYLGKNKNYKRKFENNEEDEKKMKIKSEKGITLINLIIVFLLILILVAVLYLVYANLVGRGIIKTNNNLLSDNIKQDIAGVSCLVKDSVTRQIVGGGISNTTQERLSAVQCQ